MRIVSGKYGGRRLVVPAGRSVRPTPERVREAWFSILGGDVCDARVLDLFAGSGALGLEALSRGAAHVTFVEKARASLEAIQRNVEAVGAAESVAIHRGDAMQFAEALPVAAYDIALADPPYADDAAVRLATTFTERPFARLLVVEHQSDTVVPGDMTRKYGDTAITFLRAP